MLIIWLHLDRFVRQYTAAKSAIHVHSRDSFFLQNFMCSHCSSNFQFLKLKLCKADQEMKQSESNSSPPHYHLHKLHFLFCKYITFHPFFYLAICKIRFLWITYLKMGRRSRYSFHCELPATNSRNHFKTISAASGYVSLYHIERSRILTPN